MKRGFRASSLLMINFGKEHCDLWEIFNRSIELRENNIPDSMKTKEIQQMKFVPLTFSTWEPLPRVGLAALLGCAWNQSNPCPELLSSQLQYLFPEELAQGQRSGRALVPGPLPGGFAGHCLRRGRGLRRFRVLLRRRLLGGRDIPVCFYTGNCRLLRALGKRRTWITWRTNPARSGISWRR